MYDIYSKTNSMSSNNLSGYGSALLILISKRIRNLRTDIEKSRQSRAKFYEFVL